MDEGYTRLKKYFKNNY